MEKLFPYHSYLLFIVLNIIKPFMIPQILIRTYKRFSLTYIFKKMPLLVFCFLLTLLFLYGWCTLETGDNGPLCLLPQWYWLLDCSVHERTQAVTWSISSIRLTSHRHETFPYFPTVSANTAGCPIPSCTKSNPKVQLHTPEPCASLGGSFLHVLLFSIMCAEALLSAGCSERREPSTSWSGGAIGCDGWTHFTSMCLLTSAHVREREKTTNPVLL